MLTKNDALFEFFSGFGFNAYPATAVPDDAECPYITFYPVTASYGDGNVSIQTDIWFDTESEEIPNKAAQEIVEKVSRGGLVLPCDSGGIWMKMGSISVRNSNDPNETGIKRRSINIEAEFLTND